MIEAAQEQLARFSHTDFTIIPYEVYVELAERLIEPLRSRGRPQGRVLQRRHRGDRELDQVRALVHEAARRDRVRGAFHGRTMLSMTMTSKTHPYGRARPVRAEVYRVPYPHEYRGIDVESALRRSAAFVTQVAAEAWPRS